MNVRIRGRRGQPTHLEVRPAQRPLRVPPFRLLLLGDKRRRLRHHHRREMKRTTAPPRGSLAVLRERRSRSWDAALRLQGRRGGVGERFKTCLVYLYDIMISVVYEYFRKHDKIIENSIITRALPRFTS